MYFLKYGRVHNGDGQRRVDPDALPDEHISTEWTK